MSTRINYTEAERASFAVVPETCPAIEKAMDEAFKEPDFTDSGVAEILAKYGIQADEKMRFALHEVVARVLFPRKMALQNVVMYHGTFPLRAALVGEIERSRGMAPSRNHFQEWIDLNSGRPSGL